MFISIYNESKKRVEYLAPPSGARGLGEKEKIRRRKNKKEKKKKEELSNNDTPILRLYCLSACFARRQSMTGTLQRKSFRLKALCRNG